MSLFFLCEQQKTIMRIITEGIDIQKYNIVYWRTPNPAGIAVMIKERPIAASQAKNVLGIC
jgi:hypothetical protein